MCVVINFHVESFHFAISHPIDFVPVAPRSNFLLTRSLKEGFILFSMASLLSSTYPLRILVLRLSNLLDKSF